MLVAHVQILSHGMLTLCISCPAKLKSAHTWAISHYSVLANSLSYGRPAIDLSHTRGAPPSNARENEDVWDTSAWQHR